MTKLHYISEQVTNWITSSTALVSITEHEVIPDVCKRYREEERVEHLYSCGVAGSSLGHSCSQTGQQPKQHIDQQGGEWSPAGTWKQLVRVIGFNYRDATAASPLSPTMPPRSHLRLFLVFVPRVTSLHGDSGEANE
ncbi:hypothetical protein E2C01_011437 [Portunus trituberculatus]|uniref:Uncharacterized protein n=1 Tax=Portunus trituberculatus TaxID=210409 RepID=A0A5B7DB35_PORTR|nr:hypothetical protein [Portunus trituberculatus]